MEVAPVVAEVTEVVVTRVARISHMVPSLLTQMPVAHPAIHASLNLSSSSSNIINGTTTSSIITMISSSMGGRGRNGC